MAVKIQYRRGLSTEWTAANPVLSQGEPGYETNTGKFKVGDGSTPWASLSYSRNGVYEQVAVVSNRILDTNSSYLCGSGSSIATGVTLTIPESSQLIVKYFTKELQL